MTDLEDGNLDAKLQAIFLDQIHKSSGDDIKAAAALLSQIPTETLPRVAAFYARKYFSSRQSHDRQLLARWELGKLIDRERANELGDVVLSQFAALDECLDAARFEIETAVAFANKVKKERHKGAATMLAKSPKQKEKTLVRECWDAWQTSPKNYRSKAAFARDMREKFPNLESQSVIEGWCRAWERESKPSVS